MSLNAHIALDWPLTMAVDLRCAPGEMLALVGPSGAGKSTVLRALAGLIPSRGSIVVDGQSWSDLPTHRRPIGLVSQQHNLLPHLNARQNVAMGLRGSVGENNDVADEWLRLVNLAEFGDRLPHSLSGGQQQRVAIARALARTPKLLLLDEPFSSVDAATKRKLYEEVLRLRERVACATVLVTHDVKEAALLADEICVLDRGQSLVQMQSNALLSAPPSGRIAKLLGWRNVIGASAWAQQPQLQALFSSVGEPDQCVLVPHRSLRLSRHFKGAERLLEVELVQQLMLPHQSWALVRVGDVVLWSMADQNTAFSPNKRHNVAVDMNDGIFQVSAGGFAY